MIRVWVMIVAVLAAIPTSCAIGAESVDFERQILPIFLEHCVKCHGEAKQQARMSLHSAEALQKKWQADEHLLVAGDPEHSELYERITLPTDSPKRMPKGADPLPQEKIDLIAAWIRQGAVLNIATQTAEVEAETPPTAAEPPTQTPALPEVAAAPPEAIQRLAAAGARVSPLYAESALLDVSFAGRGKPAGDADVALLADVAEQVYSLNLADAQITPAGLVPLAKLNNLASLHLERSSVTDEGLAHVGLLQQLQYLNLYGTAIADDALNHLAGLKHLRRLYLWQTKASYDAAMALEAKIPGLVVNLGFDHPVVARKRLTAALATAQEQAKEAKAALDRAKHQLQRAEQDVESLAARVSEIEQQLKQLDGAADGS